MRKWMKLYFKQQRLTNGSLRGERRADSRQHRDDHLDDLAPQALLLLIHSDYEFWVLNFEFWILSFELWIKNYALGIRPLIHNP